MPVAATNSPETAAMTAARPTSDMSPSLQRRLDRENTWSGYTQQRERIELCRALDAARVASRPLPVDLTVDVALLKQRLAAIPDGVEHMTHLDVIYLLLGASR